MNHRERANSYAKFYVETKTLLAFLDLVKDRIGGVYMDEAEIAWEAIDQYEGTHRPAPKAGWIDGLYRCRNSTYP